MLTDPLFEIKAKCNSITHQWCAVTDWQCELRWTVKYKQVQIVAMSKIIHVSKNNCSTKNNCKRLILQVTNIKQWLNLLTSRLPDASIVSSSQISSLHTRTYTRTTWLAKTLLITNALTNYQNPIITQHSWR